MSDGIIQEVINNILMREFGDTINSKSNYARLSKLIQQELIEKIKQTFDIDTLPDATYVRKLIGDNND